MSATDDELGPDVPEQRPVPEVGELQLRKVMSTMNDLEPPRDDLFVQRALLRGRARTARRRNAVLGAAAALVVVGAVGTAWVTGTRSASSSGTAGSAAGAPKAVSGAGSGSQGPLLDSTGRAGKPEVAPSVLPPARDASTWFGTLATAQTAAFDTVEPALVSRWPNVFSGAYAADPAGSQVVVTVTRHDAGLEALVREAMPSPADVGFALVRHSYAEKARVVAQIVAERAQWRAKGVEVLGLRIDGRGDDVVVLAGEPRSRGLLEQRYGDLVRVVPSSAAPGGKLPDGSTLPTLQR